MFFCESCRKEKGWPTSGFQSRGKCEVCKSFASCHEVKSSLLPLPTLSPVRRVVPVKPTVLVNVSRGDSERTRASLRAVDSDKLRLLLADVISVLAERNDEQA